MSIFEIGMLVCFGASWPLSSWKMLQTKRSEGKSLLFLFVIIAGYICGILHKMFYNYDAVIWLYGFNLLTVLFDLSLTIKYRSKK
jgi:hypothetical protein